MRRYGRNDLRKLRQVKQMTNHETEHTTTTYQLRSEKTTFKPDVPEEWSFQVLGPQGPPKSYRMQHERRLHLIIVRDDLSTFSHLHPTLGDDLTWTVDLSLPTPGPYKAFADVAPDDAEPTTLRLDLQAEGDPTPEAPHQPSRVSEVDGYRVELTGELVSGAGSSIEFHVTRDGVAVEPDPYLGAAGHLVAISVGDLEYLHVHPVDGEEADTIPFMMHAPGPGLYRLFLQFLHEGEVRTTDFTIEVTDDGPHGGAVPADHANC